MSPTADDVVHPAERRRRVAPFGSAPVRRLLLPFALLLASAAARPAILAGQDAPADTAAVVLDLAVRLEAEGRLDQARLLYRLIQERYPDSPQSVAAGLRLAAIETVHVEREGRTELMVWSTLYGLWLGVGVPAAFGSESSEAYGLGMIVGAPGALLAARAYSRGRGVTDGHARAITFGGSWGTWQGFGWQRVFEIGDAERRSCVPGYPCHTYTEESAEAMLASMIVGGLTGIGVGAAVANSREIRAGTASAVNFGALWGTWYGVVLGALADLDGDDMLAAVLLGGDVGLVTTALLAPGRELTVGRTRLISIAGVGGAVIGAGVDLLLQPGSDDVAILIPGVLSAVGLYLGARWTEDRSGDGGAPRPNDGALLDLRDGRWSVAMPTPTPALLRTDAAARRWEPGLRFELLRARF